MPAKDNRPIGVRLKEKIKINPETGCWEWQGTKPNGYGYMWIRESTPTKKQGRMRSVHRLAYQEWVGPLNGLNANHRCLTKCCLNPEHLYAGTQKQNIADTKAQGRDRTSRNQGSKHPEAKLSDSDVILLRQLSAHGVYQKDIARRFSISQTLVSAIARRKQWKHI